MNPIVREQFPAFTIEFEGSVPTMYLDILGLVTVGNGCLIDTPWSAAQLPFVHATGHPATEAEIRAAWQNVKHNANPKLHWKYAVPFNNGLRLTDVAVEDLMLKRLDANDEVFAKTFPGWEGFPPEVQLAIHSMGWAMGAGFPTEWPNFTKAVRARDWAACAENCKIREAGNPGVVPRNRADKALFEDAARDVAHPLPAGIVEDDRQRIERMHAVWFWQQTGEPEEEQTQS